MAERVKGVRDFLGKEAVARQATLDKIKESFSIFGFEPVETPVLEYLSLFTGKSGQEIESQLYSFSDKKGEKLALRPEHTISKLRVISTNKSLPKPFKGYSIGNVWRYEDTAKGRYREFIQADIDVYGSSEVAYDAEVLACIDFTLKRLGIIGYKIHVNNRKILQDMLDSLEVPFDTGLQVLRELDKIDKVGKEKVLVNISALIGKDKAEGIEKFIDGSNKVGGKGKSETDELMRYLKEYGIDNAVVDNALVRGLAYYDGNIFEFIMDGVNYGTIASGGRYDRLSNNFEVEMPMVGCSIGFERVMDIILSNSKNDEFTEQYCVLNVDNPEMALKIVQRLRSKNVKSDILLGDYSLSKGLDYCNSKKIRYAIIVGNRDLKLGDVTLRDLLKKEEKKIKIEEL